MTQHEIGIESNVSFFLNLINSLNEGGVWLFPATMQVYIHKNGCLIATNEKAYQTLLHITPERIHHLFKLDLTITNPELN